MFEVTKENFEGKTIADLYQPKRKHQILRKHYERFVTGNIKPHFETEVILHNGKKVWFEVLNSFINIGNKTYLLGTFRDITERKKLQEELVNSEKQFRMIWENSTDSMILVDKMGRIRLINSAFSKMVAMHPEDLLNQSFQIVVEKDYQEKFMELLKEKLLTGQFINRFEGDVKLANGKQIYFEASLSKIELSGEDRYLVIIRDITDRKKLFNELIRAKEEAEEANRLKRGFISMMSHEIRTPLNVILGFTTVLKEIFLTKSEDEEVPKYFEAIDKAGKRLLNTITQILDISRIEAGEFEVRLKPLNLNDKVLDAVQQIQVLANQRNIKFDLSLDSQNPVLFLDEYCLDGILINLINNAVKFSYENSKIDIETMVKGESVIFIIKDYGIGMSEEYLKHLFKPFSQEEVGYSRPYEGTGLGLALTKKFIELMNSEIRVKSEKDKGTEFEVTFPLKHYN